MRLDHVLDFSHFITVLAHQRQRLFQFASLDQLLGQVSFASLFGFAHDFVDQVMNKTTLTGPQLRARLLYLLQTGRASLLHDVPQVFVGHLLIKLGASISITLVDLVNLLSDLQLVVSLFRIDKLSI